MNISHTMRLDEALVELGYCNSLSEAGAVIMAGKAVVNDQRMDKPGVKVGPKDEVRVKGSKEFVSRGGLKLHRAIEDFGVGARFAGAVVLDAGASTGGFTDCCLKLGAEKVFAVDVGTNQLDWSLRQHPKVHVREQTDIRSLGLADVGVLDFIVADLSFIGLAQVLPGLVALASPKTELILLVKPQFELPSAEVPKGGVVTSDDDRQKAVANILEILGQLGFSESSVADSRLAGRTGNVEIFVRAWRS